MTDERWQMHADLVCINTQTANDGVMNPFGELGASENGASIFGNANWEEFTYWQSMTIQSVPLSYLF